MFRLVMTLFCCGFGAQSTMAQELKITSHPFPPWQFKAEDGSVQGINIDILNHIGNKLGIKLSFSNQTWARAWITTKGGGGDALISASRKKPREPYVWFPKLGTDLWVSKYVFFSHKDNMRNMSGTYQDILDNNLSVCIVNGYSYHKSFWRAFPYRKAVFVDANGFQTTDTTKYIPDRRDYHSQIVSTTKPELCFNMLAKKRVDVLISDESIGLYIVKKLANKPFSSIKTDDLVSYSRALFGKGYPIAFAKNSDYPEIQAVGERFWKELLVMQKNGEYQKIVDRWLN